MPDNSLAPATYIDIFDFIAAQRAERYQSFVVHGEPMAGKTKLARTAATRAGGLYIDVLALVNADENLCERTDTLDVAWLEQLVRGHIAAGADLIVVDEWDWLWPIWNDDLTALLRLIEKFYGDPQAVVMWVMPWHRALEGANLRRASGVSRVLALEEIASVK